MCIIIASPAGNSIPEDHLKNGFESNSDGAGIAIAVDGKVVVNKFLGYKDFINYYRTVAGIYPTVVHFRIGTQGTRGTENVHPFMIHDIAMFHNGIFSHDDLKHTVKSDTNMLADILNGLPEDWFNNDAIMHILEGYCGYGSKLVFMDGIGNIKILNESKGENVGGRWYSNSTYKFSRYSAATYNDNEFYSKNRSAWNGAGGKTYKGAGSVSKSTVADTTNFSVYDDLDEYNEGYWYRDRRTTDVSTVVDSENDTFHCECCETDKNILDMVTWNNHPICLDCMDLLGADAIDQAIEFKTSTTSTDTITTTEK